MMGGSARLSFAPFNSNHPAPPPGLLGWPYGDSGDVVPQDGWSLTSGLTPTLTTGDDATPNWILSPLTAGDSLSTVQKTFANPGLTTELTVEFQIFFTPTTGAEKYDIDFVNASGGDDILGIFIQYNGTGSGGAVSGTFYDTGDDSGTQATSMSAGHVYAIKVTYDGTGVKFYVDGVLQFTWTHVLDHAINLISKVYAEMHWATGPGQTMQMKGLTLLPGLL